MAARKTTSKEYIIKGKTVNLKATSRIALKIGDTYYTTQAEEERQINPEEKNLDIIKEWESIFESVNKIVDKQAEEIIDQ